MGTVFAYIVMGELRQVVVCICISPDVGCFDVAYLFLEAMRQPDLRDKRGETLLPRLFCFQKVWLFLKWRMMTGRGVSASTSVCLDVNKCIIQYFINILNSIKTL